MEARRSLLHRSLRDKYFLATRAHLQPAHPRRLQLFTPKKQCFLPEVTLWLGFTAAYARLPLKLRRAAVLLKEF